MRTRDAERRQRVAELLAAGEITSAEDYYHAAMIFQHAESPEDIWQLVPWLLLEILRCAQDDNAERTSGKLVPRLLLEILRCAQDDNGGRPGG